MQFRLKTLSRDLMVEGNLAVAATTNFSAQVKPYEHVCIL